MKKVLLSILAMLSLPQSARADLFGGDLPLLAEIVMNTLSTLNELESQSTLFREQMAGIKDRIRRVEAISELVQPKRWDEWRDPVKAVEHLRKIYFTLPKEYRTEKADQIDEEISRAMEQISKTSAVAQSAFASGKQLERMGAESSPGAAEKLTASGTGTLVALASQNQVMQSHITSLLSQMLAESSEKEARSVVSLGSAYGGISSSLSRDKFSFSSRATSVGGAR